MGAAITGRKKYTNDKISKFFFPGTEPEGWVLGCTKEYSEEQQQSTIKKWKEEDYRAKQKDTRGTTTYKNKIKQIAADEWLDSEKKIKHCQKLSEAATIRWTEAEKQKASERMKEKWLDENYSSNQIEALKAGHKDIYLKHPEYIEKISQGNIKAWENDKINILLKQAYSKDLNKTWNTSKPEKFLYEKLIGEYGAENVKTQYNLDPRYPFRCDFYIVSEDLFIELQGTWMHGKHPFDINNPEDIDILEKWKEKAIDHPQYASAIEIWTHKDVMKREYALKNNLNIKFIY